MASALLAAGHTDARRYPVGRLLLEHAVLDRREARQLHALSLAINSAVMATQPTKNNAGGRNFKEFLKALIPGPRPVPPPPDDI